MEPEVLAAWIGFAGTLIAAWVASLIGKRWLDQERLKGQLKDAKEDIRFLLEVERIQAEKRNPEHPMTALREARRMAKERGLAWSGKHTKSKVENVR
ncbi:hypothetical protein CCR96_01150 [Halochromatium roseum]|nr:hypothetical protein [Halochromatium roseum]